MRTDNIKVTTTIQIPYDKPDKNGNIYTKEAVEKAVNNLRKNLPIIFRDESEKKLLVLQQVIHILQLGTLKIKSAN